MRRLLWLAFILTALLVVGCGNEDRVKVSRPPKYYNSIVSLSPGITEIVALQLGGQRLKGRTEECNFPQNVLAVPIVMKKTKPDYEKLAQIAPELVVYDASLFNDADIAKIKQLGCDVFAVKTDSLKSFIRSLYELGGLTKSESAISEYVDKIEGAEAAAAGAMKDPKPKVALLMPGKGAEHFIAGVKSFQADLIRASGGEPVGPNSNRFDVMDVEQLIKENPEIIFVAGEPESVTSDPRLQSIKALKTKRVISLKQDVILRAGSRVDKVIGALSKCY